tara:strand:- start:1418 stop:2014 length:597 start_codon:yes stop_codon:yes gene_type:complete
MQEKSKPYMLFIFSDFEKGSTILKDIPLQLSPVSSSKYLKYNYTDSTVVCNFESNLPFQDLREFIDSTIGLIVEQWYLFEHPDKMAVHIPDTLKLNLFDLETENRKYEKIENKQDDDEMLKIMDYFLSNSIKNLNNEEIESFYFNEEEEDSLMKELKLKKNVTFVKPTLDELLEKVKESGVEKLTKYEKQILDEYARN